MLNLYKLDLFWFGSLVVAAVGGYLVCWLGTYRRLYKANTELLSVSSEVQKASEAKSAFLAVMSHELRTPLTAIMGYVEIICMGVYGDISPEVKNDLGRVLKSSEHLLRLINGILDFTKMESGQLKIKSSVVLISVPIMSAYSQVKPILETKRHYFTIDSSLNGVRVKGDQHRLEQIFLNLFSNASKFTPPGGLLNVSVRETERFVLVNVRDNGIGMSPSEIDTIFEPFVQLETGMTRSNGGTGLGLTISKALAKQMGGDLTCVSQKGIGSVFTLRLPAVISFD